MKNNQVCGLAHNWRTTGAPVCFKVRRFAPVRQLRQLLNNWQLEWRNGPRLESTAGKLCNTQTDGSKKLPVVDAAPSDAPSLRAGDGMP
jgi:hypothetical protein